MATYQPETSEWMRHAKAGHRPYGMLAPYGGDQLRFLSTVKVNRDDSGWLVQEQAEGAGHLWWRIVNETQRVRRVQVAAEICEGRIAWNPGKKVRGTSVTIADHIDRTAQEAEFFTEKNWSASFRVTDSGVERVRSAVGDRSFESEFDVLRRSCDLHSYPGTDWSEMEDLLKRTDSIQISKHTVVGDYVRYGSTCLNLLLDAKDRISRACLSPSRSFENFIVWGVPGEGKTFFVTEIARCCDIPHDLINLAKTKDIPDAQALKDRLSRPIEASKPHLYVLDEFDKRLSEPWLCTTVFDYLNENAKKLAAGSPNTVFVIIGSTMPDKDALLGAIRAQKTGGQDLLSRVPHEVISVPPLSLEDRLLLFLKHVVRCGREKGLRLKRAEKSAIAHVLSQKDHRDARWLADMASRAVARIEAWEDGLKYGHLFDPGPASQYTHDGWVVEETGVLCDQYVYVEE